LILLFALEKFIRLSKYTHPLSEKDYLLLYHCRQLKAVMVKTSNRAAE